MDFFSLYPIHRWKIVRNCLLSLWIVYSLSPSNHSITDPSGFLEVEIFFWIYFASGILKIILIFRFFRIRSLLKDTLFQSYLGCLGIYISLHLFFYTLYLCVVLLNVIDVNKYMFLRPFVGKMEVITYVTEHIFISSLKVDRLSFIGTSILYLLFSLCTTETNPTINTLLFAPYAISVVAMLIVNYVDTIIASDFLYNIPLVILTAVCLTIMLLNFCSSVLPIAPFMRDPPGWSIVMFQLPLIILHAKLLQVGWFATEKWVFDKWKEFYEYIDDRMKNYDYIYAEEGSLNREFESAIRIHSIYSFQLLPLLTLLWIFVCFSEYRNGLLDRRMSITPIIRTCSQPITIA